MMLSQTIIPIYLPMPSTDGIPAEEVNVVVLIGVGIICLLLGFCIGLLLHDKIFKI